MKNGLLVAAFAALIAIVARKKKSGGTGGGTGGNGGNNTAVDILKSITVTFDREGVWQPESATGQKKDKGNYYPYEGANRVYYGTNYGVTAAFLVEHKNILKIPITDKNVIKNLTKEQARDIFTKTIGARMRYNELKNQFVANFLFDWMVHRPTTCVKFICGEIFGFNNAEIQSEVDKAKFSDGLMTKINGVNPSDFYNSMKFWRFYHLTYTDAYVSFRKGVYNRIAKFKDFDETNKVKEMRQIAYKKAFG